MWFLVKEGSLMIKKGLLIVLVLLLVACGRSEVLPEKPKEPEEQVEIQDKEEEILDGDQLVEMLLSDRGEILDIKRIFDPDQPYLEVLLKEGDSLFIYKIDPQEKEIISFEERQSQDFNLEQAYFRAKELVAGADGLHAMVYKDGRYVLTILRAEEAFEVALDQLGLEAELLGPVQLKEIEGRIEMDLFQAMEKFHVNYGDIDLREIYYRTGDSYSAFIVLAGYQELESQEVYRTFEINTYNGVIREIYKD